MIVGIDLGTTNSLIGVWRDGKAELIPNALGHVLTPSCVSVGDSGDILVGLPARDRLLTKPALTAATFKRYMGTEKRVRLGAREYRPEELSALVLKSLVADAEAALGEPVTEAIITVPAYFNNTQREATRIAGELAGLKVERLLNEPTAAALAYGLHHASPESQFLVFDLGGGTFDVSILEMFSGVMEVRATAGDNFLGGEDFTEVLVKGFLNEAGRNAGIVTGSLTPPQTAQLRIEAERVKRALSSADDATFQFYFNGAPLTWEVNISHFEKLSDGLLQRLCAPIERALRDSQIKSADLERIVMVGGSTRLSIVYRMLTRLFGRFPNRDVNPDEAIAMGAAVQAGLKARDAALKDVVMTDVCPYSLGLSTTREFGYNERREGLFMPIIERNTVIPASRSRLVGPVTEKQELINLKIYQGESHDVKDNIALGNLNVMLPNATEADRSVEVRFTYDINGLLEVQATVQATNITSTLVIEQTPGSMSAGEIAASLDAMKRIKVHPREWMENQALVERMKRLYEQNLGARRDWIGDRMGQFNNILDRQDPNEIAHARKVLTNVLEQFEGAPIL